MKKITLILGVLAILSLGLMTKSCSLDTAPTNSMPIQDLETLEGIELVLNGLHRWMYNQTSIQGNTSQAAGGQSHTMLIADHLGEDMIMNLSTWFSAWINWTGTRLFNSVENLILHGYYYVMIGGANTILEAIDNIEVLTEGEARRRDMLKGNALAYRAFGHFMAVQFFANRYVPGGTNDHLGIVLVTEPTIEAMPRSTVAQVYAQINADLEQAVGLLTGNTAVPSHKSYFRANTVHGLLARVALTQGRWERAAEHAVLAREGRSLATADQLLDGFYTISNPDWIWGSEHQDAHTTFFFPLTAHLSMNFNSAAVRTGPRIINHELYLSMAENDVRRYWWDNRPGSPFPGITSEWVAVGPAAGIGMDTTIWGSGPDRTPYIQMSYPELAELGFVLPRFGVRKFLSKGRTTPTGSADMSDLVHMRVSEMFLIEAEAQARLGDDAAAAAALTELMEVREPGFAPGRIAGETILEEIMRNRRIELWGEGFRFFDLKRQHLPLQRTAAQGWTTAVAPTATWYIPPTSTDWTFPFPLQEMNANYRLVQNPL
ncbi:MAG: RagB/SusD family nutrient uptake outer membrane protein [Bacteroidales bacterium]|nr:RagB/SusD family nutrient uptake outer membrane protein [Bacteroidales bacterium]